jgi:hypothetical protein
MCLGVNVTNASDCLEKTPLLSLKQKNIKNEVKQEKIKNAGEKLLRGADCTVTIGIPGVGTVSATAHAGWLLSNTENAYERACAKTRQKIADLFGAVL